MKKTTKKGLFCAGICTLILSMTGCSFLWNVIESTLTTTVSESEKDEDHIEPEDDGSIQYFATSDTFKKLEKFHGDLNKAASYRKVYSVQVNNAKSTRNETGFVYPYDYNSRAVGEEKEACVKAEPVVDGMKNYTTPTFVRDFNNNPEKYLNKETVPASRGANAGYLDDDSSSSSSSSSTSSATSSRKYTIGENVSFLVAPSMEKTNDGTTVDATLMEEGDHCYIFLASNETFGNEKKSDGTLFCSDSSQKITKDKLQNLAKSFDELYAPVTNVMGSSKISNAISSKTYTSISETEEEKIVILIYDIFGDKLKGNVVGYFWAGDLFKEDAIKYSNKIKMFYLDSYMLQNDINENTILCTSTLVHEFTHMLLTINKCSLSIETWFTEMMAMTSEDIVSKDFLKLDVKNEDSVFCQRLPYFNVCFPDGFSSEIWSNSKTYLSAYSNTYAFGAYLLRNYGGIKLMNKIASNSKMNEDAITKALSDMGYSETFSTVLAKFGQILVNTDSTSKEISLNKSFTEKFNSETYNISAIDLKKYYVYLTEEDKTNDKKTIGPYLQDINYRYSLGGWGIEVKSFGDVTNYRSFDAFLPRTESCDLYIYVR